MGTKINMHAYVCGVKQALGIILSCNYAVDVSVNKPTIENFCQRRSCEDLLVLSSCLRYLYVCELLSNTLRRVGLGMNKRTLES